MRTFELRSILRTPPTYSANDVYEVLRDIRDKVGARLGEPFAELEHLQEEIEAWSRTNFKEQPEHRQLLGVVEEVGELAHAQLKKEQGIRDGVARFKDDATDAVGDIIIYLCDYCARTGLSLKDAVTKTWEKVRRRNWVEDPKRGGEAKKP